MLEGHIVRDLKAHDRCMPVSIQRHGIHGGVRAFKLRKRRLGSPGIPDVVLAPRAEGGRKAFAVHEKLLVALAPHLFY